MAAVGRLAALHGLISTPNATEFSPAELVKIAREQKGFISTLLVFVGLILLSMMTDLGVAGTAHVSSCRHDEPRLWLEVASCIAKKSLDLDAAAALTIRMLVLLCLAHLAGEQDAQSERNPIRDFRG